MCEKTHINTKITPSNMPDIKRQTAVKCTIKQIKEGNYVQKHGWDPNYIEIQNKKISRVNILAAIISKESNTITIDDGTSNIAIRFFNEPEKADNLSIGDIILIIGRPREYNNERYIVPEITRKIQNKKWIEHRKKELELQETTTERQPSKEKPLEEEPKQAAKPPAQEEYLDNEPLKLLETIKQLDKGEGADTETIIKESRVKNAEKHIQDLVNEGEIYEIRPGKLKIL